MCIDMGEYQMFDARTAATQVASVDFAAQRRAIIHGNSTTTVGSGKKKQYGVCGYVCGSCGIR